MHRNLHLIARRRKIPRFGQPSRELDLNDLATGDDDIASEFEYAEPYLGRPLLPRRHRGEPCAPRTEWRGA